MGVDAIADEDRRMLEVDVDQLRNTSLSEQQYWIHAVEAAQQAGTRALELTEGAICSWADILQNWKFEHLPTTTPIPFKETDHPVQPADLTTPSSTRTPKSENCKAGADKMRKRKGQMMIRPLAGSAHTSWNDVVGHERIHTDHDKHANSAPMYKATDIPQRTNLIHP